MIYFDVIGKLEYFQDLINLLEGFYSMVAIVICITAGLALYLLY